MKSEKVRILFWCDYFQFAFGGAEVWAERYVAAMRRRGYEIEVLTDHGRANAAIDSGLEALPVHFLHANEALHGTDPGAWTACLQRAAEIESAFAPHLIHFSVSTSPPMLLLFLMSRGMVRAHARQQTPRPANLMCLHQEWRHPSFPGPIHERFVRQMDWVCCFSQSTLRLLLARMPADAPELIRRSSAAPHAIPDAGDNRLEADLLARADRTIGFIGRLSAEKGVDLALRAFSLLRLKFSGLRMIVAGSGPELQSLVALARELDIAEEVNFTGWLSAGEVRATLRSLSVLVVPSREESFGLIALEAAHEACPVVAAAVGGLPETCIDGVTGLLCPPEDPVALAAASARLLSDPELAKRLGLAARARVLASPGWEDHIDAYEALIQRLVGQRCASPVVAEIVPGKLDSERLDSAALDSAAQGSR
jgi:glycosyltransferase involved in cell wall biosynthesis